MFLPVPAGTPPLLRRVLPSPQSIDPDEILSQAASLKSLRNRKLAPMPPKRTSSFKDLPPAPNHQPHHTGSLGGYYQKDASSMQALPMESDAMMQTSFSSGEFLPGDMGFDTVERFLSEVNSVADPPRLTESHKSPSSSEELLSTPGSQSRSGSLERILENPVMSGSGVIPAIRSRSSSHDRSLTGSSPIKSSDQKTPDTDTSDTPLPPPPPSMLVADELGAAIPSIQPPPPLPISPVGPPPETPLPLGHLRQSLRKTRSSSNTQKTADENESPDSSNVTSLDSSNAKHVINRYGTIPKGARIGAFLASLEQGREEVIKEAPELSSPEKRLVKDHKLSDSCSNVAESVLKMPTPEIRRKVEEWQAGVVQSLADEGGRPLNKVVNGSKTIARSEQMQEKEEDAKIEHTSNVKPSSLLRSSSVHNINSSPVAEKPPLATFLTRQKSDLSGKSVGTKATRSQEDIAGMPPGGSRSPTTNTQVGCGSLANLPHATDSKPDSPLPEWKRSKPTPSPRGQNKTTGTKSGAVDGEKSSPKPETFKEKQERFARIEQKAEKGSDTTPPKGKYSSQQMRSGSTSSEELLENRSTDSRESVEGDPEQMRRKYSGSSLRKPGSMPPPPPHKPPEQGKKASPVVSPQNTVVNNIAGSTEPSRASNTDSLINSAPKVKLRNKDDKKGKEKDKDKEKVGGFKIEFPFKSHSTKEKDKDKEKPTIAKDDKQHSRKSKFGAFFRQNSEKEEDGSEGKRTPKSVTKFQKEPETDAAPVVRNVPAALKGAKQILPTTTKPIIPGSGQGAPVISSPDQLHRTSLHHVELDKACKEKESRDEGAPITKEVVAKMCTALGNSLAELNSAKSKHSSNFLHLSEEVQSFYITCSSYVESLPPHGKFQFRELLTALQKIAESLKMCSSSNVKEYDKILSELQHSIKEIGSALKR